MKDRETLAVQYARLVANGRADRWQTYLAVLDYTLAYELARPTTDESAPDTLRSGT